MKAALPPDAALVSFVRYDRAVFDARKPMPMGGGSLHSRIPIVPSYMAFVLPPSGVPVALQLGSVNAIDPLVRDWRQAIVAIGAAADGDCLPAQSLTSRVIALTDPTAAPPVLPMALAWIRQRD